VNLKRYCFLKGLVVDDDYDDDVYDDDFNDDEFLHANDDDIDDDRMFKKLRCLIMMIGLVNVCIIESYVHAFIG
jgi:hypothetical protein